MKVQEDLVWNKNTGDLIGYVDLGDDNINFATFHSEILVLAVKSVDNPLAFTFATFATKGVTRVQLFMIFWRCVAILELTCFLKVIAVTCDGASENRAFYKMFKAYTDNAGKEVVYSTLNLYSTEKRFIWLFCDAPHLLKTAQNCLANSGSHHNSRLMWKDG